MCTCAEGYSTVGMRAVNRSIHRDGIRRKLDNLDVPDRKREGLCYELLKLGGSPQDRQLVEAQLRKLGEARKVEVAETQMLRRLLLRWSIRPVLSRRAGAQ